MAKGNEYLVEITKGLKVTEEAVQDLVTTALCGGIGYWAKLDNSTDDFLNAPEQECIDETVARLLMERKTVKLIDEENGEVHDWTLDELLRGIQKYCEGGYRNIIGDDGLDMFNVDAEVADMIVQLGIFGKLVYG